MTTIEKRSGKFSRNAQGKMFIFQQTGGLKITMNSVIEAVQFLLQHEFSYAFHFITKCFFQYLLENYFGHQRSLGARKDNPSVRDFGINDNAIRNQKVFQPIASNVKGQDQSNIKWTCLKLL